ncbi:Protein N-acetyltransferase, RimJ/RimL family [Pseudoxanthobacter soli DSM 19599]|uniref:Protein N-acetyltransferase, RimJ/RimL family n=1 Tax=Pseudoxanthobacter soli DSM 19599 TaxID=1123029 RepID=A0A1M7ZGX0_9HYPH|nr:GNAT family N-acetyltransferase [Pseudoxanthobacter soli]SHO64128.1 Protein N-acetyltransferase, RimJ/RimL family [Pseudoxanthobacter soli DSM 19599]
MIIETPRLRLRPWTAGDIDRLAALNAEPEVNAWLGGPGLSRHDAAVLARITGHFDENGWGIWLVESRQFERGQVEGGQVESRQFETGDGAFLGLAGLQPVRPTLPLAPATEAVWRLRRAAWGRGYVVEAMTAILTAAVAAGAPADLVALVARPNLRSAATAGRLGFRHDPAADFLHPDLAADHPLRPHRVFRRSALEH